MTSFQFNIMDAAGYGYYRVWQERAYLLKLAFVPILIKFACTIAVFSLDLDKNVLRQGLIMLPSIFAEGWVLAQFLRTLLKNERWPMPIPEVPNMSLVGGLLNRAKGIIAAVLVYVLLGMLAYFSRYLAFELFPSDEEIESARKSLEDSQLANSSGQLAEDTDGLSQILTFFSFVPMVLLVLGVIWTFRLMWIYIPFSVLMPVKSYLRAVSGFMSSVYMLILFLASMVPATFVAIMLVRVIYNATDGMGESIVMLGNFVSIFISVSTEITVGLITTTAFAWVMRGFLPKNKECLNDFPSEQDRYKDQ